LHLLIESEETAGFRSKNIKSECGFFIKIDTGYHRTGIDAHNIDMIDSVLRAADSRLLHFKGFLTHS